MGEAIGVVGAVVSAGGSAFSASSQASQLEYQQDIAENNKAIAEKLALDAEERGKVTEKGFRKSLEQLKGQQRAGFAKAGFVIDQDTALDVILDTAEMGEIDALTIRNNAEREAYGYRAEGEGFNASAAIAGAQAGAVRTAGGIQVAGDILGTVGKFYSQ